MSRWTLWQEPPRGRPQSKHHQGGRRETPGQAAEEQSPPLLLSRGVPAPSPAAPPGTPCPASPGLQGQLGRASRGLFPGRCLGQHWAALIGLLAAFPHVSLTSGVPNPRSSLPSAFRCLVPSAAYGHRPEKSEPPGSSTCSRRPRRPPRPSCTGADPDA